MPTRSHITIPPQSDHGVIAARIFGRSAAISVFSSHDFIEERSIPDHPDPITPERRLVSVFHVTDRIIPRTIIFPRTFQKFPNMSDPHAVKSSRCCHPSRMNHGLLVKYFVENQTEKIQNTMAKSQNIRPTPMSSPARAE